LSPDIYCQIQPDNDFVFISAQSGLKLRSHPDFRSEIIAIAKFGEAVQQLEIIPQEVELDGIIGNWCNVNYRGKIGFMFSRYLSRLPRIDLHLLKIQPSVEYPIYGLSRYFHLILFEIADSSKRTIKGCGDDPDCKSGVFETVHYLNKEFRLIETHSWDSFDEEIIGENWSFEDAKDIVDWVLVSMWDGKYELTRKKDLFIFSDRSGNYSITVKKISESATSIRWETSH
jgi:hypothetical protein